MQARLYGEEREGQNQAVRINQARPVKKSGNEWEGGGEGNEEIGTEEHEPVVIVGYAKEWIDRGNGDLKRLEEAFGEQEIVCMNTRPYRSSDGSGAQKLKLRARDFLGYCAGEESLISSFQGESSLPFQAHEWRPFSNRKELKKCWSPLDVPRGPAFVDPQCSYLEVGPAGSEVRLHGLGETEVCFCQLAGRTQYVLYAPGDASSIYGNETHDLQSLYDPFRPDLTSFPRTCAAQPHVVVLGPGDCLCVPKHWWYTSKCLDLSVVARYQFETDVSKKGKRTAVPEGTGVDGADDTLRDIRERASLYKQRGNREYAYGRFREACEAYTRAIEMLTLGEEEDEDADPSGDLCVVLCNRAQCWLKRKMWTQAIHDCNRILRTGRSDDITLKALYRRARAEEGLGDAESAERDFKRVLELQPHNRDAHREVENYRSILHRLTVLAHASPELRRRQGAPTS